MKSRARCVTCGKKLPPLGWHLVYDEQKGKSVKVCTDDRQCQKPFVRKVVSLGSTPKNRPFETNQA